MELQDQRDRLALLALLGAQALLDLLERRAPLALQVPKDLQALPVHRELLAVLAQLDLRDRPGSQRGWSSSRSRLVSF